MPNVRAHGAKTTTGRARRESFCHRRDSRVQRAQLRRDLHVKAL
jgi:hypothetical protein